MIGLLSIFSASAGFSTTSIGDLYIELYYSEDAPAEVVLTPDGEWMVLTDDDVASSDGFPKNVSVLVETLQYYDYTIQAVAVIDDDTYAVVSDYGVLSKDVPDGESLAAFFEAYADDVYPVDLAFAGADGWVGIAGGHVIAMGDVDDGIRCAIDDVYASERLPRQVVVDGEDWLLLADQWYASAGVLDTDLDQWLRLLRRYGYSLDTISFAGDDWALHSNIRDLSAGPTYSDTLTYIENNIDGGTLWDAMDGVTPGLSIAIIEGGRITGVRGYGVRIDRTESWVQTTTPFMYASLSKYLTGLAVVSMVEDEDIALSLDTTVSDVPCTTYFCNLSFWLDDAPMVDSSLWADFEPGDVTLTELLTHRSRLPLAGLSWVEAHPGDYVSGAWLVGLHEDGAGSYDWSNTITWGDAGIAKGDEVYSNQGFLVLQAVLEDASGDLYTDLIQDRVLDPLDMRGTFSIADGPITDEEAALLAYPHHGSTGAVSLGDGGGLKAINWSGAAGLAGTAEDYAGALLPLLTDDHAGFFSDATDDALVEMCDDFQDGIGFSCVVSGGEITSITRTGSFRNHYRNQAVGYPGQGDGIVILMNRYADFGTNASSTPQAALINDIVSAFDQVRRNPAAHRCQSLIHPEVGRCCRAHGRLSAATVPLERDAVVVPIQPDLLLDRVQ